MDVSKMKAFLFCTLLVAIASLTVMFYYSVAFTQYSKMGVRYVETLKNGYLNSKGWTRGVRGNNLNTTGSTSGSSNLNASRHIDVLESLRSNKLHEVIGAFKDDNNNATEELTQKPKTEVAEPKTEVVEKHQEENKPIAARNENEQAKELCPSGSKQGKRLLFTLVLSSYVCFVVAMAPQAMNSFRPVLLYCQLPSPLWSLK